jgi:glycosyltransferase involved in cell wall biosynthesis
MAKVEAIAMKILCVTYGRKPRSFNSSYNQLAKFIGADVVSRPVISSVPWRVAEKAWHFAYGNKPHLMSGSSFGYHFEDRLCEERAFWRSMVHRPDIVHIISGDTMLDMLLRRRRLLPGSLVATFHFPPEHVADRFERVQRDELAQLDGAVVLASCDLATYRSWLGREKVIHVPHGIDIDVFQPAEFVPAERARFLFVGVHARDFEITHRVIDRCHRDRLAAEFLIVTPPFAASYFTGCDNVKIMSDISEEELISQYRSSDALFLPLTYSTANNSILEALACGVPVISTRIGGVPDYVDESCGWLLPPSDVDAAYERVRSIARDRQVAWDKRPLARRKAETLSWQRVAATLLSTYTRLREGGVFAADSFQVGGRTQ